MSTKRLLTVQLLVTSLYETVSGEIARGMQLGVIKFEQSCWTDVCNFGIHVLATKHFISRALHWKLCWSLQFAHCYRTEFI